jgi:hypothetical protein
MIIGEGRTQVMEYKDVPYQVDSVDECREWWTIMVLG